MQSRDTFVGEFRKFRSDRSQRTGSRSLLSFVCLTTPSLLHLSLSLFVPLFFFLSLSLLHSLFVLLSSYFLYLFLFHLYVSVTLHVVLQYARLVETSFRKFVKSSDLTIRVGKFSLCCRK